MPKPQPGAAIDRKEFAEKYGASEHDLEAVAAFGRRNHLNVVESNVSRRSVVLSGTVASMSKAFGTDLQRYEGPDGTYRGRDGYVHVPEELAGVVEGVFGLDDRPIGGRNAGPAGLVERRPLMLDDQHGGGVNGGDPPNTNVLTVPQVAGLYDFPTNSAAG